MSTKNKVLGVAAGLLLAFVGIKKFADTLNKQWMEHKDDICPATMVNDTTMTLLDNRRYDSTNKFLKMLGAKPKETPDTFYLMRHNADTTGFLAKKKSYAELIDSNKRAIVNVYHDRYESFIGPDTVNIALK